MLEEKRKELLAISSIFDATVGQKRPAAKRYGKIHPFSRQTALPCGRTPSALFLKLNEFFSYLIDVLSGKWTLLFFFAANTCAAITELYFNAFKAAVKVINASDMGFTACRHACSN